MFEATDLNSGWCSVRECEDRLRSLQEYMGGDIGPVRRAIGSATGTARSYLRVRWPDGWPFVGDPPSEIRGAVASLATYGAMLGVGMDAASKDLLESLRLEAKRAEEWLRLLAAGKADLDLPRPSDAVSNAAYSVARPPGGEFGFSG